MAAYLNEFVLKTRKPGFTFVIIVEQGQVQPVHPMDHLVIQLRAATDVDFVGVVEGGAFKCCC